MNKSYNSDYKIMREVDLDPNDHTFNDRHNVTSSN